MTKIACTFAGLTALFLTACGANPDDTSIERESVASAEQAITGSNPEFDATWLRTFSENYYRDIAAADYGLYLVRTADGDIDVRSPTDGAYWSTIVGSYTNVDWVDNSWNLIATSNANRAIYINAQNSVPEKTLSYPSGITAAYGVAAIPQGANDLNIWIQVPRPPASTIAFRKGTYSRNTGLMTWDPNLYCNLMYQRGLASKGNQLMTFLNYVIVRFQRLTIASTCSATNEIFAPPYQEHAYTNPQRNVNDTAAPTAFDFANGKYYMLDRYYESSSYIRQTLVTIPDNQIVF